jgi:hypothetical protein
MTKPLPDELLASAAEAYTGCSRYLLFRLAAAGRLPVREVGERLFFARGALDVLRQERAARRSARRRGQAA